jgi:hypothetical protein
MKEDNASANHILCVPDSKWLLIIPVCFNSRVALSKEPELYRNFHFDACLLEIRETGEWLRGVQLNYSVTVGSPLYDFPMHPDCSTSVGTALYWSSNA